MKKKVYYDDPSEATHDFIDDFLNSEAAFGISLVIRKNDKDEFVEYQAYISIEATELYIYGLFSEVSVNIDPKYTLEQHLETLFERLCAYLKNKGYTITAKQY